MYWFVADIVVTLKPNKIKHYEFFKLYEAPAQTINRNKLWLNATSPYQVADSSL